MKENIYHWNPSHMTFYTQAEHKYPWQAAFVDSEYQVKAKKPEVYC